ncbi:replication protein [Aerococcaceae bacterium DSM 111022]|nr:replication protein [Aerococcaceae bacterium DSM 111022]
MANKRIKGITIQLGADSKPLQKVLKDVEKSSTDISKELREVEQLLKFNPNNTVALTQKQELLEKQIGSVAEKLDVLKEAEADVQKQFEKGEIAEEQYRAFQREIEKTEDYLGNLENKLKDTVTEQESMKKSSQQLNKLLSITNSEIDDYAETLGDKLVRALKEGKASSAQLDVAIDKVGRAALGADTDIDKLKNSIDAVDDGSSLNNLRKDLDLVEKEADEASESADNLIGALEGVAGAMGAGIGLSEIGEQALDLSSLDTTIDISFDVPEESKAVIKESIRDIEAYGVEGEEALEGIRRQWALNADASDEANQKVIQGAGAITRAYAGIDFAELIQEVNEIGSELGVSDEEALALTNSLLAIGFPPEQIDTIAEYGKQLTEAGYSAEEVQALMAAGVNTGTWNIDNLLDGLKEGRILIGEFGSGIDDATAEMLEGTKISADQLQQWGKDVSAGGEAGKKAMEDVAQALMDVEDKTKRNELGVALFGTIWEDQGENILETILNMDEHLVLAEDSQQKLNDTLSRIDEDPMVQLKNAMNDIKVTLEPLLVVVAELVSKVAEWISQNPELASNLTMLAVGIGIVSGAVIALAGASAILSAASWPIVAVIVAIIAIVGALIYAIQNWGEITDWISDKWGALSEWFGGIAETVKGYFDDMFKRASENWTNITEEAGEMASGVKEKFTDIKSGAIEQFERLKSGVIKIIEDAKEKVSAVVEKIKGLFDFEWKMPKIKIPSITKTGSKSILGVEVPTFGIEWYAKGGIMTRPTVFGQNGNNLMVGGEAGPEAVLPLNSETLAGIGAGIAKHSGFADKEAMDELIYLMRLLVKYSKDSDENPISIDLDGVRFAELIRGYLDAERERTELRNQRLNGVPRWN